MLRSTFSTTTIASSTTMPIASTRPNSVIRLIEKPSASMPANVVISDDDDRDHADDRRAEALQEQVDDQHDEHDRLEQRVDHLLDRQPDEVVGVERDDVVDALRGSAPSSPSSVLRTASDTLSPFAPGCR